MSETNISEKNPLEITKKVEIEIQPTNILEVKEKTPKIDHRKKNPNLEPTERVTAQLKVSVIQRLRNLVYWNPDFTLGGELEKAINKYMDDMEKEFGVFDKAEGKLRTGRRAKLKDNPV